MDEPKKPSVDDIGPPIHAPKPEKKAKNELLHFAKRETLIRNRYEQETKRMKSEHTFRIRAGITIFVIVCVWLVIVVGIMIWQGAIEKDARMPDAVLVALLATTTVNVIGMLLVVIRYLFPSTPIEPYEMPDMKRNSKT
ncbi:MAG: hypothetical protein L0Y70_06390 [Gemmataceae bacterium]|nr:hypothetical protein [Gemmataceae bacterium]